MNSQQPFDITMIPDTNVALQDMTNIGKQKKVQVVKKTETEELTRLNDLAKKHPFGAWYKHGNHTIL